MTNLGIKCYFPKRGYLSPRSIPPLSECKVTKKNRLKKTLQICFSLPVKIFQEPSFFNLTTRNSINTRKFYPPPRHKNKFICIKIHAYTNLYKKSIIFATQFRSIVYTYNLKNAKYNHQHNPYCPVLHAKCGAICRNYTGKARVSRL